VKSIQSIVLKSTVRMMEEAKSSVAFPLGTTIALGAGLASSGVSDNDEPLM
jgi:hypothetical protein